MSKYIIIILAGIGVCACGKKSENCKDFSFGQATLIYKAYPPDRLIGGKTSFTVIVPEQYDSSKFAFSNGRSAYIGSFKM